MNVRSMLATGAAVTAAAVGGAAIANAASSSAPASSSSAATSTQAASTSTQAPPAFKGPAHGTAAHEDAEKAVTGTDATKAQDAAVKSVGSGTAGAVTTDYTQNGYEVTVTKSDGSTVEVHLDSSFNVMRPPGGAGGSGGPGGPPPGAGYGG